MECHITVVVSTLTPWFEFCMMGVVPIRCAVFLPTGLSNCPVMSLFCLSLSQGCLGILATAAPGSCFIGTTRPVRRRTACNNGLIRFYDILYHSQIRAPIHSNFLSPPFQLMMMTASINNSINCIGVTKHHRFFGGSC